MTNRPPSPPQRFLKLFRLKVPMSPSVPTFLPLYIGAVRLAGILDHEQVVLPGDRQDRVQVGRQPLDVHGDDRLGALGDRRLQLGRVHVVGARVDVHEHRDGVLVQRAGGRGQEGEGGGDHLVARPDADRGQRHVQGRRAAAGGQAVLRADVVGPLLLQRRHLRRGAAGHDAAVQHLVDEPAVVLGDDRPVAVVAPLQDRGPAVDRQFLGHVFLLWLVSIIMIMTPLVNPV